MKVKHSAADRMNPYVSPENDGVAPASHPQSRSTRPVGTILLAVLLLLMGVWFVGTRVAQIVVAYSHGGTVELHPSYFAVLTRDAISAVSSVIAAVGILAGHSFGWWAAIAHSYWRLTINALLPLLGSGFAYLTNGPAPGAFVALPSALTTAVIFSLIIAYLQTTRVTRYFGVNRLQCLTANFAVAAASICIGFGIDLWATLAWGN